MGYAEYFNEDGIRVLVTYVDKGNPEMDAYFSFCNDNMEEYVYLTEWDMKEMLKELKKDDIELFKRITSL